MTSPPSLHSAALGLLSTAAIVFAATGCVVPKKKYDDKVEKLESSEIALAQTRKQAAEERASLESTISALRDRVSQLQSRIEQLEKSKKDLKSKLEKARGTLQMYESETGSLEQALQATKKELKELREKQARQRERLRRFRQLAERLAETFEAGELSVKTRDGKMVIEMPGNVLFDSGKIEINEQGREVLKQLAGVLDDVGDREFLVAGHTDDVPIDSPRFDSNWELSTARAVNVVQFLQEKGVPPKQLAAAGYSKYEPIASNETAEGRAKNRRIEIILMPDIESLPSLPDNLTGDSD
ncbi:MAG: OmpA family protein [Bradymonadaceae bacterium]